MSAFSDILADNPYHAPQNWQGSNQIPPQRRSLPVFCSVVFIGDIVLVALRALMVPLSILGYFELKKNDPGNPIYPSVIFEILTAVAIVVTALPANVGLLMKQKWGVAAGYVACLATLSSLALQVWQVTLIFQHGATELERKIAVIAGIGGMLVRLAILGSYFAALHIFSSWKDIQNRLTAQADTIWSPPATS